MSEEQKDLFKKPGTPELHALAMKIAEGRVYGSWNVPEDLLYSVFMPLVFASEEQLKDVAHVYAIHGEDKTANMAVNGYPIFAAMRLLTASQWKELVPLIKDAQETRSAFIKDE